MGAPKRICADLAEADAGDLALALQCGETIHGLFNGMTGINAMDIVEVDLLHAEPPERRFAGPAHIVCAFVYAATIFTGHPHDTELRRDPNVRSARSEETADQFFIMIWPVGIGGIEQIDPDFNGAIKYRQRLRVVTRSIELAHPHAAEADGRYFEIRSELASLHPSSPCQ